MYHLHISSNVKVSFKKTFMKFCIKFLSYFKQHFLTCNCCRKKWRHKVSCRLKKPFWNIYLWQFFWMFSLTLTSKLFTMTLQLKSSNFTNYLFANVVMFIEFLKLHFISSTLSIPSTVLVYYIYASSDKRNNLLQ